IETQHTLGYGVKATTDECPEAIFVNAVQCLVGFVMQGIMAVIIFYKMTLPRHRQKTLLFSRNAVICPRNKKLCLMFRIGDMRKNDIVGACIRAFFVRTLETAEGEKLINHQNEIKLHFDDCSKYLFFNWPLTIYHIIDKQSPLYYFSPSDLSRDAFEIAVILEGTIESTGQMTQHRTSYMPMELLWGRKFEPLLTLDRYRKNYEVDLSKFDNLIPICTPLCSAAYSEEYDSMQNAKSYKATSHILMEPDWPSILQICDLIRQNDVQPKYALNTLRKKLNSPNPHSAMYALLVLESMVKNCGTVVHEELTTKANCEYLHELAKTTTHENVRSKLLELIQAWTFAFRKNPKHVALNVSYSQRNPIVWEPKHNTQKIENANNKQYNTEVEYQTKLIEDIINLEIDKDVVQADDADSQGFITVKHKKFSRKRPAEFRKKTLGINESEDDFGIEKKMWIYLYRLKRHITEDKI
ncbi:hypothetical protein NQ314_012272, partial [Rhamnusium bicolor]